MDMVAILAGSAAYDDMHYWQFWLAMLGGNAGHVTWLCWLFWLAGHAEYAG